MKALVLLGTFAALAMSIRTSGDDDINKPEYSLLILLALVGMMLMISADNLMALYMGVELQSLPLYVVAAMRTSSLRSSEAGLKYFLLGALSSGLLLYGASTTLRVDEDDTDYTECDGLTALEIVEEKIEFARDPLRERLAESREMLIKAAAEAK